MINILLTGIGGQGTVLAAKLLAHAASTRGWRVRSAETIGMAQRGGSVISHVRIANAPGEDVHSSLVPKGSAQLVVAFEPAEAARVLPYLSTGGTLVSATSAIQPVTVALSGAEYSAKSVIEGIKKSLKNPHAINATQTPCKPSENPAPKFIAVNDAEILQAVGNARALNTVLLAVALNSGAVPLGVEDLKQAVRECVKPKYVDLNLHAIDVALQFVKNSAGAL